MNSFDDAYALNGTQKLLRAVVIASLSVTGVFVATRCWIRVRLQAKFSIDDYLLVTALACFAVQSSFGLYAMDHGGFGRKTAELPRDTYLLGLKWMVLTQCTYTLALTFAKLSIALLQLRVMGLSASTLRRVHHASAGANVLVGLYEFFTLLFQCYPGPDGAFRPVVAVAVAGCADSRAPVLVSVYVYSAANIALDWYYSCAMVPLIWRLQNMKTVVKVSAIVILGMGVFASVATIVRLRYLVGFADSRDPLYAIVPVGLWSWAEESIGLCAACVATFRPLLRRIPGWVSTGGGGGGGGGGGDTYVRSVGDGDPNVFATWKSRLDGGGGGGSGGKAGRGGERRRVRGVDGLRMEELVRAAGGRVSDDEGEGEGDVECGGRRAARRTKADRGVGGGVVEYVSDGEEEDDDDDGDDDGDDAIHASRFRRDDGHDDGTMTITTTRTRSSGKDDVEVQTVLDDADSQKSILQQKSVDSWRA